MRAGCATGTRRVRSACAPRARRVCAGHAPGALRVCAGCAPGVRWVRCGCTLGALRVRAGCAPGARRVRAGCAPGARQANIVGSGRSGIGIHIDVDNYNCTRVPVDTYLTLVCGAKYVILLPPNQHMFEKDQPFPDIIDAELARAVVDAGGYYFVPPLSHTIAPRPALKTRRPNALHLLFAGLDHVLAPLLLRRPRGAVRLPPHAHALQQRAEEVGRAPGDYERAPAFH